MNAIKILFCAYTISAAMEVMLEKADLEYHNPKYFNVLNVTMRRLRRNSPYILNAYFDLKSGIGNNLTIKWSLYEVIGGHHVLTPINDIEYIFCDYFKNDPYFGKMIITQIKKNWTCPFPPGIHKFENIKLSVANFPYVSFTYSSLLVRVYSVVTGFMNKNDLAFRWNFNLSLKQKLQDRYRIPYKGNQDN